MYMYSGADPGFGEGEFEKLSTEGEPF